MNNTSISGNATLEFFDHEQEPLVKKFLDYIVVITMIVIMMAIGCMISPKQIWHHIRIPIGVLIGMLSQFVALPLLAFCLIKALSIPALQATGMMVLATSPGGTTSNVFAYLVDGDVSLSVTMTTFSTLLALGMMPLNLWMYAGYISSDADLVIPYSKIGISLISVTTPVLLGMIVKWKLPKCSLLISKVGSYLGLMLIVVVVTMEIVIYPDIFSYISWQLYLAMLLLPVCSLFLGYGLAVIGRQPLPVRKTIAIECSAQNVGLSVTIITLSFPFSLQKSVIAFSYLYPFPMMVTMGAYVLVNFIWKKCTRKQQPEKEMEDPVSYGNGKLLEVEYNQAPTKEETESNGFV